MSTTQQPPEEITKLAARLPELLWRLKRSRPTLSSRVLPMGVFKHAFYLTPELCINEIYSDLDELKAQKTKLSTHYLSERIAKKINVLVRLCQLNYIPKETRKPFAIERISTRQQWLQSLENEIKALEKQQQALNEQLVEFEKKQDISAALSLRAELGEVEQQLTQANESWNRTVLVNRSGNRV